MKKEFFLAGMLLCFVVLSVQAARVDTVMVRSRSMNKEVQVVYVVPDKVAQACPVVYLLHGYGGNAKTWIGIKPQLPSIAEEQLVLGQSGKPFIPL